MDDLCVCTWYAHAGFFYIFVCVYLVRICRVFLSICVCVPGTHMQGFSIYFCVCTWYAHAGFFYIIFFYLLPSEVPLLSPPYLIAICYVVARQRYQLRAHFFDATAQALSVNPTPWTLITHSFLRPPLQTLIPTSCTLHLEI
jgi:hypothetical protein